MSAAKPQPEASTERQPERHDERIQQRSESTESDATKRSPPPVRPPKLTPSSDATKQASPLGWELSKAAADARADRNRVLWGLLILVIAALGLLAAGLLVKEEVFWAATAPVFAAAAMAWSPTVPRGWVSLARPLSCSAAAPAQKIRKATAPRVIE